MQNRELQDILGGLGKLKMEDEDKQTVLLLGEVQGYLMQSIQTNLMQADFNVEMAVGIDEIGKYRDKVDAVLVHANEDIVRDHKLLVYVKDRAADTGIPVFTFGNAFELEEIKQVLPHSIKGEFKRPINVRNMVEEIKQVLDSHSIDDKKKILVVDDSLMMQKSIQGWLEGDYHVMIAASGAAAIKSIVLNHPDLILLDYEMPICDGRQTLEMIRSEKDMADIPVIFLTGRADPKSIMEVMGLNPAGYLLKTTGPEEIKKYIDNFFHKTV